jgi:hypothetical protein
MIYAQGWFCLIFAPISIWNAGQKFLIAPIQLSYYAQINLASNPTSSVEIKIYDEQTFRSGL